MTRKVLLIVVLVCVVSIGITIAKGRPALSSTKGVCNKRNVNATCGLFCKMNTCLRGNCFCTSPSLKKCGISKDRKCKKFAKTKDLKGMSCAGKARGRRIPVFCVVYQESNSTATEEVPVALPNPVQVTNPNPAIEVPNLDPAEIPSPNPSPDAEVPPAAVVAESGNEISPTHWHYPSLHTINHT